TAHGLYCGDIIPDTGCIPGFIYECFPNGNSCIKEASKSCDECNCLECPPTCNIHMS
ncbi:15112_t:CDS:2, partial [Funneliformis geosporum]